MMEQFSRDGRSLALVEQGEPGRNTQMEIWEITLPQSIYHAQLTADLPTSSLAIDEQGKLIAVARSDGIHLIDIETGERTAFIQSKPVHKAGFRDGGVWGVLDDGIHFWTIERQGESTIRQASSRRVRDLNAEMRCLDVEAEWLALRLDEDRLLIETREGNGATELSISDTAENACISATGKWLAATTSNQSHESIVTVWNIEDRRPVAELKLTGGSARSEFDAEGRWLAIRTSRELAVWQCAGSGIRFRIMTEDQGAMAFSGDGQTFAYTDTPNRVRLLSLETMRMQEPILVPDPIDRIANLALGPDGERLVIAGKNGSVLILNLPLLRNELQEVGLE